MEKEVNIRRKLVTPNLIFLGFIILSIIKMFKGIEQHETWRIVMAAVGGLIFIGLMALSVYTIIKQEKANLKS